MKHVHKLARIGLFVNIIICFVARNLLLDEGQLNFHSRADGVWSSAGAGPVYCRGGSGDQHNAVRPLPLSGHRPGVCWRHRDGARQRDLSGG